MRPHATGPLFATIGPMPISFLYVRSLEAVVERTEEFLSRPVDLFARQRIVVPTAGAKAWLSAALARRLGARDGSTHDGILANVVFSYPGTISSLLDAEERPEVDPWDVERLTFAILKVLVDNPAFGPIVTRAGGPLLAARRIADRFDHYHFRRPGMILEWEEGRPRLSPEADATGTTTRKSLATGDRWQFDLWRTVRETIGQPSPPAREREARGPCPEAVLVAGLQGLSLHQIELLQRLAQLPGASCDVQAVLVHPSPPLREVWDRDRPPLSLHVAPTRPEPTHRPEVDPLVDAWLRGTRETQWLLASQGFSPHSDAGPEPPSPVADGPLLERLQRTIARDLVASSREVAADDESVRIHRCHDLSRQAEVLYDAILHAFRAIGDLAPHEVVIVSPRIAELAPHLEATFDRTIDGPNGPIHLPLLVADRGIREVSRGAELLAGLIALVGSRCSVDGVLEVAAHPLVMAEFQVDDEDHDAWNRCIERTKIRWGLDAARRRRSGLDLPDLHAHTWRLGLERMLLGAAVPDGDPAPVLGDVVPLAGIDSADIEPVSKLISIVAIVDELDRAVTQSRPVAAWCDLLETALSRLAGDEHDDLAVPLRELDGLRQAAATAAGATGDVPVPWHDLQTILSAKLTAPVGRQPLRTGAITATSMIPLRGVPFRVVCVAGFDDETLTPRESDSEDLVDRQQLLGDPDSRLDVRRGLLDCLMAARDRLIITCNGMDVKNNATTPLATPLAELVDFARRHGVASAKRPGNVEEPGEPYAAIEVFHPRHACSRRNFVAGAVVPGGEPWSHDPAALAAARALGTETPPAPSSVGQERLPAHVELHELAEFMHDPLAPYIRQTLEISTWRNDRRAVPATLPLALDHLERRHLRDDYLARRLATSDSAALKRAWAAAVIANGDVPVGGYGGDAIEEITQFAESLLEVAAGEGVPLDQGQPEAVHLGLNGVVVPGGCVIPKLTVSGLIERWHPDQPTIVLVRPEARDSQSPQFLRAKMLAVACQLVARADGRGATRAVVFNQHKDWYPGATRPNGSSLPAAQVRSITLHDDIDRGRATRLLGELCGLLRQAALRPFGTFGRTSSLLATDSDAARQEFAAFTSGTRYPDSLEAVVHGRQPNFETVFPEAPEIGQFYRRFHELTHLTRGYVYQPP
jgi:exodeoxyribonuclease V gamma subunit